MHKENWDDLRFVLAVAEHGSLAAAARALGVNHATVLRRVAAFEARHDLTLFDRGAGRYSIPPERLRVIDAAREVEAAVEAVARTLRGVQEPLEGRVRVTSTDSFCLAVLPAILVQLRAEARGLRLELMVTNEHLDLARLEAEVAVRPTPELAPELEGERAAELGFAAYGARDRAGAGQWLGLAGRLARTRPARWMAENLAPDSVVAGADSFVTLREMAAAGLGQAVIPCILGEPDPRLDRCRAGPARLRVPIWVACHAELAGVPRLAALRRRIAAALAERAEELAGPV